MKRVRDVGAPDQRLDVEDLRLRHWAVSICS